MELRSAGYPAPPGLHAQRGCSARGPFRGSPTRLPRLSWSGSAARWRSPLPGGLPQARSGSRSALITGSPPAQPTSRSEWTWTVSSTWLKYLGPGRGGSLLLGARVRRAGQQGRQGRPDRRGGTSRTGAKRAGECDGLTGLPEAIEATWPQATVQTCVVHLIRASMRFVSYGDRRKVAAALKADLHRPEPGGRLAGSDRLL